MISKRVNIAILSVLAVSVLSVGPIYTQPQDISSKEKKDSSQFSDSKRQQLYKELDLSDEQRRLLEENRSKHREEMKAIFVEMKKKKDAIRQELQNDNLDMVKIRRINDDLKKLQGDILDYRLNRVLEVRKILKNEQFKKFLSKWGERKGHLKDKHSDHQ